MDLKFLEQDITKTNIPFLTLQGREEVTTLDAATVYARRKCFTEYRGNNRRLLKVLPSFVRDRAEQRGAKKLGLEDYRKLGSLTTQEITTRRKKPTEMEMLLIEGRATVAQHALGLLAEADPKEISRMYGTDVDVIAQAKNLTGQIIEAHENPAYRS